MIIMVGASASGKTELAKHLFKVYGYTKCITTTTRQKRMNEIDGIDYHFVSNDTFTQLMHEDAFVETMNYQHGQYGMQKKDVIESGLVILDIEGANKLISLLDKTVFVVYVHASEAIRRKRMQRRNDHFFSVQERLKSDATRFEASNLTRIDLTVENENALIKDLAIFIDKAYKNYIKSV